MLKSTKIIIILALVVGIVGVVVFMVFTKKIGDGRDNVNINIFVNSGTGENVPRNNAPFVTDTADWQIYRNTEFGFEFQYPKEMYANELGEYNYVRLDKQPLGDNPQSPPPVFSVGVINKDESQTSDIVYKSVFNTIIDNYPAKEKSYYSNMLGQDVYVITTERNGKIYRINLLSRYDPVFEKILDTLEITEEKFIPLVNNNNSKNIDTINKFYELIANNNFSEAYSMLDAPIMTFQDFDNNYKNVRAVELKELIRAKGNEYEIIVGLRLEAKDMVYYRVKISVTENMLKILSTEEIIGDYYFKDNVFIVGLRQDNHFYLLIKKNGQERILQESSYKKDPKNDTVEYFVPRYSNPRFEYDNNLLFYDTSGWEFSALNVFDLKNNKVIFQREFPQVSGFSKDKQFFFDCSDYGMISTREIKVWQMPDFKEVASTGGGWIALKYGKYQCRHESDINELIVSVESPYKPEDKLSQELELEYRLNSLADFMSDVKRDIYSKNSQ